MVLFRNQVFMVAKAISYQNYFGISADNDYT